VDHVYMLQHAGEWDDWPTTIGVFLTMEQAISEIAEQEASGNHWQDLEVVRYSVGTSVMHHTATVIHESADAQHGKNFPRTYSMMGSVGRLPMGPTGPLSWK